MHVQISILIFILQPLYLIAMWDPYSPLIQTQFSPRPKIFPRIVRRAHNGKIVYHNKDSNTPPITFAMCPEPSYNPTSEMRQKYCNYGKSFTASSYAEKNLRRQCSYPVEPLMVPLEEECGDGGYRYRFAYLRCEMKKRNAFVAFVLQRSREKEKMDCAIVYTACFHETDKQILYGSYTIASPHLLANKFLSDEQSYKFPYETSTDCDDLLDQFNRIAQPLYAQSSEYVPRMVLPPELLPFALQRKPLYHYMNLAPMDSRLTNAWEFLMQILKRKIASMNQVISIKAGLLGKVTYANGATKYLGYIKPDSDDEEAEENEVLPSPEIAIPYVWWVQVYNKGRQRGIVIAMVNEYNPNYPGYFDERFCGIEVCNQAYLSAWRVVQTYPFAYIYCCHPAAINEIHHFNGENTLLKFHNDGDDIYVDQDEAAAQQMQ